MADAIPGEKWPLYPVFSSGSSHCESPSRSFSLPSVLIRDPQVRSPKGLNSSTAARTFPQTHKLGHLDTDSVTLARFPPFPFALVPSFYEKKFMALPSVPSSLLFFPLKTGPFRSFLLWNTGHWSKRVPSSSLVEHIPRSVISTI